MQTINLVWLKRDLRLTDHTPLQYALSSEHPTVLLYVVEPMLLDNPHYSARHWRFIWQSLQDMNETLSALGHRVSVMSGSVIDCLSAIQNQFNINAIFSHQEIGLRCTFERDKQVSEWLQAQEIPWHEFEHGAVIRGAKDRLGWDKHWDTVMRAEIEAIDLESAPLITLDAEALGCSFTPPPSWLEKIKGMQTGGSSLAWQTMEDFFNAEDAIIIEVFLARQHLEPHALASLPISHGAIYRFEKCINTCCNIGKWLGFVAA